MLLEFPNKTWTLKKNPLWLDGEHRNVLIKLVGLVSALGKLWRSPCSYNYDKQVI